MKEVEKEFVQTNPCSENQTRGQIDNSSVSLLFVWSAFNLVI
jgi:hypothetical protein